MPKTTAQKIIDIGFNKEMFKKEDDTSFNAFLNGIIAEQAAILEGRIGSVYASTSSPAKERVARAELCLATAEVIQVRINNILSKEYRAGHDVEILKEGTQKKVYLNEAEELIRSLVAGASSDSRDFACGALITSHF